MWGEARDGLQFCAPVEGMKERGCGGGSKATGAHNMHILLRTRFHQRLQQLRQGPCQCNCVWEQAVLGR
jgi:hypothetical protein